METRTNVWLWSLAALASGASAQAPGPLINAGPGVVAIRCVLSPGPSPETLEVRYFYIDDTRRGVFDTAGNELGSVLQYSPQRVVVYKADAAAGTRTFIFDRMIGALTISAPPGPTSRSPRTLSGECEKVDASRQKF